MRSMLRGCSCYYAVVLVVLRKGGLDAVSARGCIGEKLVFKEACVTRLCSAGQQMPEIARPQIQTTKLTKCGDSWNAVQRAPVRSFS